MLNNQVLELAALPGTSWSLIETSLNSDRGSPGSSRLYGELLVFYFYCKFDHWLLCYLLCTAWCKIYYKQGNSSKKSCKYMLAKEIKFYYTQKYTKRIHSHNLLPHLCHTLCTSF